MPGSSGETVEGLIDLLLIVALVAVAVRFVRIPYTVALVLAGLVLALLPDTPHYQFTPGIILTVFLPVLLFYGAYKCLHSMRNRNVSYVPNSTPHTTAATNLKAKESTRSAGASCVYSATRHELPW